MADSQFNGLFGGKSAGEVRDLLRLRQQAAEQAAYSGITSRPGNEAARNLARLRVAKQNSLKNIGHGMMAGLGMEDRRNATLGKALKRDADKKDIMDMISEFTADDGKITEDEIKIGFSELMKRGYQAEAQKWLTMSQSMQGMDLKERQVRAQETTALAQLQKSASKGGGLKFEGPVLKDKDDNYWQSASTESGKSTFMQLSGPKGATYDPDGAVIVDTKGQDFTTRVEFIRQTEGIKTNQTKLRESYKTALKKGVDVAKATLDRRTNELQQELNISQDAAMKRAGAELITEREHITAGGLATTSLPKAEALLAIASSGNYTSGDAASAIKRFKRVFGIEGTDEAVFRQGTQMMLLKMLKPLMGAKATDQDLIELKEAFARPANSREANIVFLNDFISKAKKDIKAARYFSKDPKATLGGWFQKQDRFAQLGTVPTPIAQRRVGEMIRKGGDAYKWNGTTWDKE